MSQRILSPAGRIVWGSLYEPKTVDFDGKPLVIKTGPDAGKPTQRYEFGLAIPKNGTTHWAQLSQKDKHGQEAFGPVIWAEGHKAHPAAAQQEGFAWKVTDGDSTKPGKVRNGKPGRRPCDKEGFPGHWVFSFASSFAPKIVNSDGSQAILEPNAVKPGYWVQVFGDVSGNTGATPGIYLNHAIVALQGYGPEIVTGPDATEVGFGVAALPPGATAAPVGAMSAPPATMPAVAPAVTAPAPAIPTAVPAPTAVVPNPSFLNPPAGVAAPPPSVPASAPAVPSVPALVVGPQMTAKAGGVPYESFIAKGWTPEAMRAQGYLV